MEVVEIRIDGGNWNTATGTTSWSYDWDTTQYGNGEHLIEARARDDSDEYSKVKPVTLIVDNGGNSINSEIYPVEWINPLPATFDWRTSPSGNMVTSVKEQIVGSCWCMAACSAVESNLLMSGLWEAVGESGEPDLSENHLDWWNGFNDFYNQDKVIHLSLSSRGSGSIMDG